MSSEVINGSGLRKNVYFQLSLILIAGLILRIYLSTLISFEGDFNTWRAWGNALIHDGFSNFYSRNWCDYMPGYLYILRLLSEIAEAAPWLSPHILFKLPANLADLGISVLIFIALKPISSIKAALTCSIAYFFNPAALSNSTFWGQVDSFHAFPILLAIILCLRKYYILTGLFAAIALMIKPQTVVLFPVIGFIAITPFFDSYKRWRFQNFVPSLKILITAFITFTIITLPFIWHRIDSFFYIFTEPLELIIERFRAAYNQYEYTSLNAFNFWGAFTMWWSDMDLFLGLTLKTWGTIMFASFYAAVFISLFRFKLFIDKSRAEYQYLIYQAVTLILFSMYLFVTRAHERHLLPAIVFFTLIIFRSWIFPYLYAIVSGVYVCNMIFSYIQLTTDYNGVPDIIESIVTPSFSIMYIIVFLIVFVNFLNHAFRFRIKLFSAEF